MGKWKLYVPILLAFLCLAGALAYGVQLSGGSSRDNTPNGAEPRLQFQDEAHGISLTPYYDTAEDTWFLFLPACTSLSDLTITDALTGKPAAITVKDPPRDTDSSQFQELEVFLSEGTFTLQLWQCDNLPTLFLQGDMDMLTKVHADKENKLPSQVTIWDANGDVLLRESGTLSGRGNGTWAGNGSGQAKRPYNLRFSRPISFGPLEGLKNLCLFAEYADESKLRNSLALYAGQELGIDYTSPYAYVNVYANGEYLGLYGVVTKKEYTKHIEEDQIQAVFELAGSEGATTFFSDEFGQLLDVSYGHVQYVRPIVNRLESALRSQDWDTCAQLLDLDSFARMYVLEEFLCNVDMTYASQYFYIDKDSVIHTMLPWDFDYSMGTAIEHFDPDQVRSTMSYHLYHYSWYPALLQWDDFRQRMASIIEACLTDEYLESLSDHLLADIQAISRSRDCDIRRWKTAVPFSEEPLASGMESLSEFHDFFTSFFPKRRAFLLDYFQNYTSYCHVTLQSWEGSWYTTICIPKGSRPADYLDAQTYLERLFPGAADHLSLVTESGISLSEIGPIEEDLTLIAAASPSS